MYAHIGDRLVVDGETPRTGMIIGVPHEDGSPPYVVKWLADGHIAMVVPDQFTRVVRGESEVGRIDTLRVHMPPTEAS